MASDLIPLPQAQAHPHGSVLARSASAKLLPNHNSSSSTPLRIATPLSLGGLSGNHGSIGRSGSASNLSINFSPSRPPARSYPVSPTAASPYSASFPPHSLRPTRDATALFPRQAGSGFSLRSAYSWSIPRHLDFALAASQLRRLLFNPKSVYQDIYFHKQTKNQWHRDDPAFTLMLAGVVTLSSLLWGIVYYQFTFPRVLVLLLRALFLDYLIVGFGVACLAYLLANRTIHASASRYTTGHSVSLLYAWDVHLNAYVPYLAVAHGVHLLLVWVCTGPGLTARLIGNSVYGLAWILYVLHTYWGYRALPFLLHPEYVLYLLVVLAIVWLAALNGGVNFSALFLDLYT